MRKEQYFSLDNISSKPQEMLALVDSLRRRHDQIRLLPNQAALLVLDMQDYFLQPGSHAHIPSAPAIIERISCLRDVFSAAERPVIFTRHLNVPADAGMMSSWWRELISPQDAYSQISPLLDITNQTIIEKKQYDAFWGTKLDVILRQAGVRQVVIGGVMTHLCCETTARSAFVRGYEVFFAIDGTATYTEALHNASLLTLSHGFAIPVLVDEVRQAFDV